jgi:hypothetical protein
MRVRISAVVAGIVAAMGAAPAFAQGAGDRTVEQYTCMDVMRESGQNRDVAIAFLHGYLIGKSGTSKFNVETLAKQTDTFIDQCLENPKAKAEDVMVKIKG